MVRFGDSSDSEEERTDRFKNERDNKPESKLNLNTFVKTTLSSRNNYEQPARPKLCAMCSRSINMCVCRSNFRDSPRVSPYRERAKDLLSHNSYSYKRRSPTDDYSRNVDDSSRRADDYLKRSDEYSSYKIRKTERMERTIDIDSGTSSQLKIMDEYVPSKSYWDGGRDSIEHQEKKCKKKLKKEKRKEEERHLTKVDKHDVYDEDSDVELNEMDDKYLTHETTHKHKKEKHKRKDMECEMDKEFIKIKESKKGKHRSKERDVKMIDIEVKDKKEKHKKHSYNEDKPKKHSDNEDKHRKHSVNEDKHRKHSDNEDKHRKVSDNEEKLKKLRDNEGKYKKDKHKERSKVSETRSEDECKRRKESKDSDSKERKKRKSSHRSSQSEDDVAQHLSKPSSSFEKESNEARNEDKRRNDDVDSYGPSLPPRNSNINQTKDVEESKEETNTYGPILPGKERKKSVDESFGPRLPNSSRDEPKSPASSKTDDYGPKLPSSRTYGPTLPPSSSNEETERYGPSTSDVRHHEDSDDETLGPLPEGSSLTPSMILLQHRANLLKLHSLNKVDKDNDKKKREEWMLELPDKHRSGITNVLAARTFKTKVSDAQVDLSWTETPEEKLRKEALDSIGRRKHKDIKEDLAQEITKKRDKHMDKLVEKSKKKKSSKSLLEMHQEKLNKEKKKSKKEGKVEERRPFSRDTDLSLTRLTQAQKQSIYKKASHLDSRFSSGRAKYL